MNIVWLSANKLGFILISEALKIKGVKIKAIVTLSSQSKTVIYDGIENKKWHKFGIKVFEIERLNNEKELIRKLSPDLIVMCGWREKIDKNILDIPSCGVIAFHPTLLPYGRGPAPIINTILQGASESGLTMFYINEHLDGGNIIAQKKFVINEDDHAQEVYKKIIGAGKKLVREYLPLVVKGTAPMTPQEDSGALFFKKPDLKNNKINFEKETLGQIYRKIKALSKPYKGAYIEKDDKRLIIWRAQLQDIK